MRRVRKVVLGTIVALTLIGFGWAAGAGHAQGYGRCPAEDSCTPDYVGGHWVIRTDPNH